MNITKSNNQVETVQEQVLVEDVRQIAQLSRQYTYRAINTMQVASNWLIGRRIVIEEQNGQVKADYGKHIIELLSQNLTSEFGNGYSETNLRNMRKFFLTFSNLQIQQALPANFRDTIGDIQQALPAKSADYTIPLYPELSWTHYERLMRVTDETARLWYLHETVTQTWSYRTLDRNINTQYYERLMLSKDKEAVIREMQDKTRQYQKNDRGIYQKSCGHGVSWATTG